MADPVTLSTLLKEGQGGIGSDALMPVAPVVRDPNLERQIQVRALRGLDPTPEQDAYLRAIMPEKEARGERLGGIGPIISALGDLDKEATPGTAPRPAMARQIQARAMSGQEPTEDMAAFLKASEPEKEARGSALASVARDVAALTLGGPAVSAMGRAIAAAPRTTGAIVGGLGLPTIANPAEKVDPAKVAAEDAKALHARQRLIASDPALQAMDQQIRETEAIARAVPGNGPGQQPLKNRQMANEQLPALRDKFNARIAELTKANLPFDKAHPDLAQWWPAIQWGGPVAAAWLARFGGNLAERALTAPWRRSVAAAEKAFAAGDDPALHYQAGKLGEFLKSEPGALGRTATDVTRETIIPTTAGMGVGMEASLYPYQHNRSNAPIGSKEREEAESKLSSENWWNTAAPGLAAGFLGGFTGSHLPNMGAGYRPVAESRNLANMLKAESRPVPGTVVDAAPSLPNATASPVLASPEMRERLADRIRNSSVPEQSPLAGMLRSPDPLPALSAPSSQSASSTPNVLIRTTDSRGIVQHRNLEGKYASPPEKGDKTKVVRRGTPEEAVTEKPSVQIDDTKPLRYED
jgi:hypothetical protein